VTALDLLDGSGNGHSVVKSRECLPHGRVLCRHREVLLRDPAERRRTSLLDRLLSTLALPFATAASHPPPSGRRS
jgi:hypothetical protein